MSWKFKIGDLVTLGDEDIFIITARLGATEGYYPPEYECLLLDNKIRDDYFYFYTVDLKKIEFKRKDYK